MSATAKVFWTGRSQAVRLPKEFRLDVDVVSIRRDGKNIILGPVEDQWAWLDTIEPLDDDVIAAALEEPEPQIRPVLDDLDEIFK